MELWQKIKSKMLAHSNQTVSEKGCSLTYEELIVYAESFAERLDGDCYGIMCRNELFSGVALLSCFAAGVTAVPLSIRYGEKHCRKIINSIGMPYMISDVKNKLDITDIDMGKYEKPNEHPALIMCTSGTSGNPKGAMLSEKNILTNVLDIADYFDVNENDTILIARPLYHSAVLTGEFLLGLFKGAKIVFTSEQFNPISLIKIIKDENITVFCGTPTLVSTMASFIKEGDELAIQKMAISGECMTENYQKKIRKAFPNAKIYSVYGLTEASPRVSYVPPELLDTYPTSAGIPLKSVKIRIVDDNGNDVPKGTVGELLVKGDNVMIGYYKEPNRTAKVLKNGWLHTKDLAYIDKASGMLYIKGRKDSMIIRGGMNIYPQEIENALMQDSRVEDVLAYGAKENDITRIGLKIKGDFNNAKEIKEMCVNLLPTYQVPSLIEIVIDIPKNGSGKKLRTLI